MVSHEVSLETLIYRRYLYKCVCIGGGGGGCVQVLHVWE